MYVPEDVRADIRHEMAYDSAVDAASERGLCINLDEEPAYSEGLCFSCATTKGGYLDSYGILVEGVDREAPTL